jgi:hypothetical protein
MTTNPNPDPGRGLAGIPARELVDELVRRLGLAETCRQIG